MYQQSSKETVANANIDTRCEWALVNIDHFENDQR